MCWPQGYKRKVTRVRAAEEGGTWGSQRLVCGGPVLVGGLFGGWGGGNASGGTSSGTWTWGFSMGALPESPGETPAPRVWGALPPPSPPLREASSWGATERGRAKKLLSHWATRGEPRRERPRDRAACPARRGWPLALWRRAGHSWGLAGWLGVPVVAGVVAWTGPWEGEQVHMGAQYTLRGRRKMWRRRGFLCALRDRKLIPRWMAACSW